MHDHPPTGIFAVNSDDEGESDAESDDVDVDDDFESTAAFRASIAEHDPLYGHAVEDDGGGRGAARRGAGLGGLAATRRATDGAAPLCGALRVARAARARSRGRARRAADGAGGRRCAGRALGGDAEEDRRRRRAATTMMEIAPLPSVLVAPRSTASRRSTRPSATSCAHGWRATTPTAPRGAACSRPTAAATAKPRGRRRGGGGCARVGALCDAQLASGGAGAEDALPRSGAAPEGRRRRRRRAPSRARRRARSHRSSLGLERPSAAARREPRAAGLCAPPAR